jgi:Ion channel
MRGQRWAGYAVRITDAFGLVLLLLIATYVLTSLTRYSGWGAVGITTLSCSSAAVALASARVGARGVRIGVAVALLAVGLSAAAALWDDAGLLAASALIQMLLLAAATAGILRTVLGHTEVTFRTILGAISVYMIFGLLFTALYAAIDHLQAGAFFAEGGGSEAGDFIFFSFTTLTTTGYGNLVPAAQPGKLLAGLEMLLGQIFLVTLIAGLVSLWRPRSRRN